jgi:hypothetical protein
MKNKSGMKSPTMPKEHFERNEGELGFQCKLKYATEMGNPADLDKNGKALADYVKKHKMNY